MGGEIVNVLLVPALTGFFTAFATYIAMRTDIVWIKRTLERHEGLILAAVIDKVKNKKG